MKNIIRKLIEIYLKEKIRTVRLPKSSGRCFIIVFAQMEKEKIQQIYEHEH
jgi:hypothetical protein